MTVEVDAGPELIQLPRGGYQLYWNEDRHIYQRVGDKGQPSKWLTGVSTLAKALPDTPDPLMSWAERLTFEGISRLVATKLAAAQKLREDGLDDQAAKMLID